ncbi:unannotated protein [freshwater metagenome]|uniref:Unannotated protein n=1 Tax=freshwater metagenome TaxID=449393 RepID=A0A6J7TNP7_9ZZZZ
MAMNETHADVDIFSFANQIASELGGPVTIEDPSWKVLAYSTIHDRIDSARRKTILGHAVPSDYFNLLEQNKVIERFKAGDDILEIPEKPSIKFSRRLAAPIRLNNEVVGSIWLAESSGTLNCESENLLKRAAGVASTYFAVRTKESSPESELFLFQLLQGEGDMAFLARYFHLSPKSSQLVVTVDLNSISHSSKSLINSKFGKNLTEAGIDYRVLEQSDITHYICASSDNNDLLLLPRVEKSVQKTISNEISHFKIAIGCVKKGVAEIHESRSEADRVLNYMKTNLIYGFAEFNATRTQVVLSELILGMSENHETLIGPLQRLDDQPATDRDEALSTLKAHYDSFGNSSEAARVLGIHPNTFRYRLKRTIDLLGLNLSDPESRLMLELQLHHELSVRPLQKS